MKMLKTEVKAKIQKLYRSSMGYCDDPDVKFMYQTRLHYLITLAIASKEPEGISFENLCTDLDRKISSRSSIQNALAAGLEENFFTKSTSKNDKRVQLYKLTFHAEQQMIKLFENRTYTPSTDCQIEKANIIAQRDY